MISQEKTPREINVIYTKVDYMPDIVFENETVPIPNTSLPQYMRPYTPELLAQIFKVMGCQTPLNVSLAEWVFTFLRCCQPDQAAIILGTGYSNIFANPRSYSHGFLVLTRLQFHRLVVAALHVHQYKKIRYAVDFRLALDFFEDRRFFIVLLSGAPGTGKSTIASLLASRLPCNYILSTDSVRHAMRSFYSQEEYPILYKSTYECGDLIDPEHQLPEKERCIKGYLAQSELVGQQLIKIISSFVQSRASLIIEGVHLNSELMIKFAKQFPNVIPFLIYIKKEEFHIQRFAVRAKYMTTDPSMNKYTRNFAAIRHVQSHLSECATRFLIPKIDNRNIDRSMETMHQTIFSYLKKLKGRDSMYDPETGRLTFLASIWKRRKQKTTSKSKTLSSIQSLKNEVLKQQDITPPSDAAMKELLAALPVESGIFNSDDMDGDVIQYLPNGTMMVKTSKQTEEVVNKPTSKRKVEKMAPGDFVETETETDIAEVTLTDFMETTDTESDIKFSMNGYHQFVKE